MKFKEAVDLLDKDFDGDYGTLQIRSNSRDKWVIQSKYGLAYCTCDWPQPYSPSVEDIEAEDWEIYNPEQV